MKHMRKLLALLMVTLTVLALGPARVVQAGNDNPGVNPPPAWSAQPYVYPPWAHPYGLSYTEWEVRFQQWFNGIPAPKTPMDDITGARCTERQSGPVWYLIAWDRQTPTVVRTCTVPAGEALLLSVVAFFCPAVVPQCGDTPEALRSAVDGAMSTMTGADVTVDGVHVANVLTRYRFTTPVFIVRYPADNIVDGPGPGITKAMAEGLFVMLAPLPAGQHTIELQGSRTGGAWWSATYVLTIRN